MVVHLTECTMAYQKPKGTRDFYPAEKAARHALFDKFRSLAVRYGYGEIETPVFEQLDLLTAKAGDAVREEIFVLEKRGAEQFGLRFDLTVPAARLFVQKQKELAKPVKWFYVDRLWRYERPQAGRLREFYQMGVELFGSDKPEADAEVIALAVGFLLSLGLKKGQFVVKLNNRRLLEGLLKGLKIKDAAGTIRLIDKSGKMGREAFAGSLKDLKLSPVQIKGIMTLLDARSFAAVKKLPLLNDEAARGLAELEAVIKALKWMGMEPYCQLDLATARGLDYYTGTVFECFDAKEAMRSIFAGGRYDDLIAQFGGEETPATGFAIGDVTLQLLLEEHGLWQAAGRALDYFIVIVGEKAKAEALKLCGVLRKRYAVDIDLSGRGVKQQVAYADRLGARKVIFIGDNEVERGMATVKDLRTGKEEKVEFEGL